MNNSKDIEILMLFFNKRCSEEKGPVKFSSLSVTKRKNKILF